MNGNVVSRVCIAGKNEIAVFGLRLLLEKLSRDQIVVLCNSDDQGFDTWQPSLMKAARDLSIKIISLEECYEISDLIFISLEFDKIISPKKFGTVNLYNIHFSKLPAYKGMYTSALPLLNGETESGVTLHMIDRGIDTGDIIDQRVFHIELEDNASDVYRKYLRHSKDLLQENIEDILLSNIIAVPQDSQESSYFSKGEINFQSLDLNLNATAEQISNQVKAYTFPEYQVPVIHGCRVSSSLITNHKSIQSSGKIISIDKAKIIINTIDYNLELFRDKTAELLDAAKVNNLPLAHECFEDIQIQKNFRNSRGWSPIIIAAFNGSLDVLRFLIERGADINLPNFKGTTPLMYAMSHYEDSGQREGFDMLLNAGANIELSDIFGKSIREYALERGVSTLFKW